ncbi:hypothetical protein C4D60_Mb03t00560 [Musa balbisiana]|uniref:Uncharacterized protein n=1 Tax=Musa balbisiana TaxID=52838 RepID=A0A4S8J6J4_MUSBA|nr:hypothetical protein C4D60_Mb03t00560 [Musa balbisiana]
MWRDTKKRSVGRNVVGSGGIVAVVVGEVMVDGEGRGPGPGWSVAYLGRGPFLTLAVILVFFLTVAEGGSGGGAGDELTLGWIPVGSGYCGSIMECLARDEFELGTEATYRILACSYYISYNALWRDSVPYSRRGTSYYNYRPDTRANPYTHNCSSITCCRR